MTPQESEIVERGIDGIAGAVGQIADAIRNLAEAVRESKQV